MGLAPCLFHILYGFWKTDVLGVRKTQGYQTCSKSKDGENKTGEVAPHLFKEVDQCGHRHTDTCHEGTESQSVLSGLKMKNGKNGTTFCSHKYHYMVGLLHSMLDTLFYELHRRHFTDLITVG